MSHGRSPPGPKFRLATMPLIYSKTMRVINKHVPEQNLGLSDRNPNHLDIIQGRIISSGHIFRNDSLSET